MEIVLRSCSFVSESVGQSVGFQLSRTPHRLDTVRPNLARVCVSHCVTLSSLSFPPQRQSDRVRSPRRHFPLQLPPVGQLLRLPRRRPKSRQIPDRPRLGFPAIRRTRETSSRPRVLHDAGGIQRETLFAASLRPHENVSRSAPGKLKSFLN